MLFRSKHNVSTFCFEWASELKDIAFKCIDYLESIGFTKFYIQNEDHYTFRPNENLYIDIHTTKAMLNNTVPKQDWGMVWCK